MRVAGVVAFMSERLDEDEQDSLLFHEFDCPVPADRSARPGAELARCRCVVPRRILVRVESTRGIMQACQQQIDHQGPQAVDWPQCVLYAEQSLATLTLRYERHSRWLEQWRP
jgi:hypothetical protein